MHIFKGLIISSVCFLVITVKASEGGFNPDGSVLLLSNQHPAVDPSLSGFDEYQREAREKEKQSSCGCFKSAMLWAKKKIVKMCLNSSQS